MKKIISLVAVVCMLIGCMAVMASADTNSTLNDKDGYAVWDFKNNCVNIFFGNEDVADRVANYCSWICIGIGSSARQQDGTGLMVNTVHQYAQHSVSITVDGLKGKAIPNQEVGEGFVPTCEDVYNGNDGRGDGNFRKIIDEQGGHFIIRADTNKNDVYECICLPILLPSEVVNGKPVLAINSVVVNGNKFIFKATGEIDNVWDEGADDSNRKGSIYWGAKRYTAIRIVDNMKSQNLMWDGETPAQWDAPVSDAWNWPDGYTGTITFGNLGCNSFDDICKLVDKGGKFEGCVVTFCVEEIINDAAIAAGAKGGDGYIFSFFANGAYNDPAYTLKATKPVSEGGWDGAYFELYNPNAADTADHTLAIVAVIAACAAGVVLASKKH